MKQVGFAEGESQALQQGSTLKPGEIFKERTLTDIYRRGKVHSRSFFFTEFRSDTSLFNRKRYCFEYGLRQKKKQKTTWRWNASSLIYTNIHALCEKTGVKHVHIFCHMVMMDLNWSLWSHSFTVDFLKPQINVQKSVLDKQGQMWHWASFQLYTKEK